METYYRWLALQYAAQRGRIHYRLVETPSVTMADENGRLLHR